MAIRLSNVSTLFSLATPKPKLFRLTSLKNDNPNQSSAKKVRDLSCKRSPPAAEGLLFDRTCEGLVPDKSTLSALMLCYASNSFLCKAQACWDEILNCSFLPDVQIIAELIDICASKGYFDMVVRVLHQIHMKDPNMLSDIYTKVISRFGKQGKLELMDIMLKEMASMGFSVDSATGNAYVIYYSSFGTLTEMEVAYHRLKRSGILIEEEAIRSISMAYLKKEKFYSLGQFLRDVGLGRRNVGNLLWNLLLLSYAANFKMKSLQREFIRMVESGFSPDLTTFNIRALAFSKMSLFWDLYVTLEHMRDEKVVPDLVTCGCVVDAYLDRRLGRNLDFAFGKLNMNESVMVATEPFVFEAMGKGDFHSSSEALLEFNNKKKWTYKELTSFYLKKYYRRNQIFWNY